MTSDAVGLRQDDPFRSATRRQSSGAGPASVAALALLLAAAAAQPARAEDPAYPFEGTWIRSNRVCAATAPLIRTYTAREVAYPSGRCTIRKVAKGGGQWEIFEECRKSERPGNYTETIRMLGPDLMQARRQAARLKIARWLRFTRCTAAAPGGPPAGSPAKSAPAPASHHPAEEHAVRPAEPKAAEPKPATP